jgi:hypothetical protein
MGTFLLHDPWIQVYGLYVAALLLACLWDALRNPASHENPGRPVSKPGRRPD